MRSSRRSLLLASGATALATLSRPAWPQTYPARPVHLLEGYGAGGAPDIIARLIGQRLSEQLGRPFVIENKPGAWARRAARRPRPSKRSTRRSTPRSTIRPSRRSSPISVVRRLAARRMRSVG